MNVTAASAALPARPPIAHPLFWLLALALAHVAVRVAISPALKWDEAEQMLWSQRLALGYGAQPPLYTWLQWGINQLLGPGVLALAVLKHGLLAATYVLMYLAARQLLDARGAWWASASMLLLPALGWDSVRDQTHTVLVTALACGAWWLLLRAARRPSAAGFAAFGLVCGLGLLAKYSFALAAGAMLAAALSVPSMRRALLSRGWWWAPLVAALVVLPHAGWLLSHLADATAETLGKMRIRPDAWMGQSLINLLGNGVLGVLLPWVLVAGGIFGAAWWRRPLTPAAPWVAPLFGRYLLLIGLTLLGMVLVAGVTNFKGRWMLPLFCVLPLAAFALRPELQRHPRGRYFTGAVVALALTLLTAAALRPWLTSLRGQTDELNHPVLRLAAALRAAGYDGASPIIAADHMLAAMLVMRFPGASVRSCDAQRGDVGACVADGVAQARRGGHGWLLIWRADGPSPGWWRAAQSRITPRVPQVLELPLRMARPGAPPAHYEYIWQPAGATP